MPKHTLPRRATPKTKHRRSARVQTRLGKRGRVGTNEWGKALVACPHCGAPAVVDATQEIWCRACGFTSAGLVGCG